MGKRYLLLSIPAVICGFLWAVVVIAGEEDTANIVDIFPDGRHRLEVGWTQLDGFDGDVNLLLPSYTYSFSRQLRFTAVTSVIELDIPRDDDLGIPQDIQETGWGDSLVALQFDPGGSLTSSPWVPDTVGLFGSLRMPTGDEKKGLTGDSWVAEIGAGWLVDMPWNFWLVPSLSYQGSFNHDSQTAYRVQEGGVAVAMYWLFPFRAWIGVEPYLGWDFDRDRGADRLKLIVGKAFRNGLTMYLEWGTEDRGERVASRDDEVLILNVAWQFGDSPPD
jgi:hypothetical protein